MRIQMLASISSAEASLPFGAVVETTPEIAEAWIADGLAQAYVEPMPIVWPPAVEPSDANIEPTTDLATELAQSVGQEVAPGVHVIEETAAPAPDAPVE